MINKVNKAIILILCVFLITTCTSKNRFVQRDLIYLQTLGISGFFNHDDYQFCNKIDPKFIDPYPNDKNPSRICINYQYYTCHMNNYCNGDKQCEFEAAQYWLPIWQDTENDLVKRVQFTKEKCEIEEKKNSVSSYVKK